MSDDKRMPGKECIVPLGPVGPDGNFLALRIAGDSTSIGTMSKAVEGRPLNAEKDLLHLEQLEGTGVFEATVLHRGRPVGHSGPALVNSRKYRSGWDAVFGLAPPAETALN